MRKYVEGYTDAWEQRKLSEIASYQPSNLSASNTDINGRFDLYDANGVIGKTNAMPQKESYITIIKDGSGVGRVRMLPPQTCYIGTMGGIFSKATNNIDFIFHTLSNFDFSTHIIGATIPHVYFSDYGNDEIGVPYEAEQKMIGKFFSNLDNLITLHQRKHKLLNKPRKRTHNNIHIFIFQFMDDMQISFLRCCHTCMSQPTSNTCYRYASKQKQRCMSVSQAMYCNCRYFQARAPPTKNIINC